MDDIEAIRKCLAGETESFGFLVKKYQNEAFSHAAAIVGNIEDASDAVQDAFLDAFRALKKFDSSQKFYPWLYAILRNRCFKLAESRKREVKAYPGVLMILACPSDKASKAAVELVEQTLLELSARDREILILKHLDGLSYENIALRLDIPAGTVMSRLYYARMKFREKVEKIRERKISGRNDNE
jgi:RNA polymerase sigma-70 factor (ECF subfamily)